MYDIIIFMIAFSFCLLVLVVYLQHKRIENLHGQLEEYFDMLLSADSER